MKNYLLVAALCALAAGGIYLYAFNAQKGAVSDYKSTAYTIEGKPIILPQAGTQYFGNEAIGDLNGDGAPDVAFLITQNNGGSGTFYYVVAALKTGDGYRGTNAVLLGDRIAPQTTEIKNGEMVINYADRKADEPMTARPSVGVSKYLKVEGGNLIVVQ